LFIPLFFLQEAAFVFVPDGFSYVTSFEISYLLLFKSELYSKCKNIKWFYCRIHPVCSLPFVLCGFWPLSSQDYSKYMQVAPVFCNLELGTADVFNEETCRFVVFCVCLGFFCLFHNEWSAQFCLKTSVY